MVGPRPDNWLTQWVTRMAAIDGEIPLTIFVNGMVLSGVPISQESYFRRLGETLAGAVENVGTSGSVLREEFSAYAEQSKAIEEERLANAKSLHQSAPESWFDQSDEQRDRGELLIPNYLHLRAVKVVLGPGLELKAGLWRGQYSAITGWCMGEMGLTTPPGFTRL